MTCKRRLPVGAAALILAFPAFAQQPSDMPAEEPSRVDAKAEAAARGEASGTVETASGTEPSGEAQPGRVSAAEVTDIRIGMEVRDTSGGLVGTVESLDSEGAVVSTGDVRAKLPFRSFGKNNLGLVITLDRAEFEAAANREDPG